MFNSLAYLEAILAIPFTHKFLINFTMVSLVACDKVVILFSLDIHLRGPKAPLHQSLDPSPPPPPSHRQKKPTNIFISSETSQQVDRLL